MEGWGSCCEGLRTGGLFSEEEREHINVLEVIAIYFGLQALCQNTRNTYIKVLTDNTSAAGAINNMGISKSYLVDSYTRRIWDWITQKNNWLIAAHNPGVLNVDADEESRANESKTEWKLDTGTFNYIIKCLGFSPEIDLFASRINKQLNRFMAYRPDPETEAINAFSLS